MGVNIYWDVPSTLDSNVTYNIKVWSSSSGDEDNITAYSQIDDIASLVNGVHRNYYEDVNGLSTKFYFVQYYNSVTSAIFLRVLCYVEFSIREQRLIRNLQEHLPCIALSELVNKDRVSSESLSLAISLINLQQPATNYTVHTMPKTYEPLAVYGGMIFLLLNVYLGVSFKDFNYGDNGLSLNVDRGAKIQAVIDKLLNEFREYSKVLKLNDIDMPIGLGSTALAMPYARSMSMLWNVRSW